MLLCELVVEVGVLVEKVTPELVETCGVELVVALDGLSAELERAAGRMQGLAARGARSGQHHGGRGSKCDACEGLAASADGLRASIADLRTGVNNIRNLQGEALAAGPRAAAARPRSEGREVSRRRAAEEASGRGGGERRGGERYYYHHPERESERERRGERLSEQDRGRRWERFCTSEDRPSRGRRI